MYVLLSVDTDLCQASPVMDARKMPDKDHAPK